MRTVVLYETDCGQEFIMDFATKRPAMYPDRESAKKGLKKLGWKEEDFERFEFLDVLATCPKCGYPLVRSDLEDYDFLCVNCDENFYSIEVKGGRAG